MFSVTKHRLLLYQINDQSKKTAIAYFSIFQPRVGCPTDKFRLQMCYLALDGMKKMRVSEIEFSMPKPSYTIDTLEKLKKDYPDLDFSLIIGADNWNKFHLWKDYKRIREEYKIIIYPRLGEELNIDGQFKNNIQSCNAPILEISSTFVRLSVRDGKDINVFLPNGVYEYIAINKLYR